jgi:hypothetical protein
MVVADPQIYDLNSLLIYELLLETGSHAHFINILCYKMAALQDGGKPKILLSLQ